MTKWIFVLVDKMILKIIFVVLKVFLMGWIYAKIAKIDRESYFSDNNNQLTPPKYVLIVGFATILFFGLCMIVTLFTPTTVNPTATWQISLVFALFTLAGFATLWNYAVCRHRFDDEGIYYTTFFGKEKFLAWEDIDEISYSPIWRCGILHNDVGEKFYFSDNLVGLNNFLQTLHDKAPNDE